jgi:leucyl aminopeptidase
MADVLCRAKEEILAEKNVPASVFTIATLTGHASLAVGPYSIIMSNGPARRSATPQIFDTNGTLFGEIFEVIFHFQIQIEISTRSPPSEEMNMIL